MSMTITEADSAMKVIRHVMSTAKADDLDDLVKGSLRVLRERAQRTLTAGVTEAEFDRWLAGRG